MNTKPGVIYIQRDGFQLYSPTLPAVLDFRFVPEMVRDLEVVDKELLQNMVNLFISQNNIPPGNLVMFLGDNVAFVKDFTMPETPPEKEKDPEAVSSVAAVKKAALEQQVKEYIELAPFEEIASKKFVIKNGTRVFMTNKDLYMSIKKAFEKEGFAVEMVIPGLLLGNNISAQPALTPQIAEFVLQHVNTLKQHNLLANDIVREEGREDVEPENNSNFEVKEEKPKPKTNKRLFLLSGVFGFLIIVLIIVYFTMGR